MLIVRSWHAFHAFHDLDGEIVTTHTHRLLTLETIARLLFILKPFISIWALLGNDLFMSYICLATYIDPSSFCIASFVIRSVLL